LTIGASNAQPTPTVLTGISHHEDRIGVTDSRS
jgi:hypothetical protein